MMQPWDWAGAEREMRRSVSGPPSVDAENRYAMLLVFLGRFAEADFAASLLALPKLDSVGCRAVGVIAEKLGRGDIEGFGRLGGFGGRGWLRARFGLRRRDVEVGFKIAEMPDAAKMSGEFGSFEAKWTSEAGAIEFTRKVQLNEQTVPVERYQALRKFIEAEYGQGQMPIVLMRQ